MKTIILTNESADQLFVLYVFLFLWVKFVKVGYTRSVSFGKSIENLDAKCFIFFPPNNSAAVVWLISQIY